MLRTLIAGASLSLLVGTAAADVKKDKARGKQLYDEGLSHYNLAEYDAAITSWKASYLLTKAPLLLFNIGQAYRLSGDCGKANTFYDSYQREQPDPKNKDELDQAITLCNNASAKPDKPVAAPDKLTVTADKPVVTTDKPVVTTDKPVVTTDKPAVTADKPVVGSPAKPGPTPSDPGQGKRIAAIAIGGAGVALGVVGVVFAVNAKSQSDKLDGYMGEWGPEQNAVQANGKRNAKLALGFGGVGMAAIVAGGVLYFLAGRSSEPTTVSITPTPGGAQLAWGTTF